MSILKIIKEPDERLRKRSAEIVQITPEIKRLISVMAKTMVKSNGIGLAAPQVGYNIRLCLINTADGQIALINPVIYRKSLRKETEEEGCLSCPEKFIKVKRHKTIWLKAINGEAKEIKFKAEGLFARVIQHEVDHLDGILIIDKNKKG